MGRVARVLSAQLPVAVEQITLEPTQRGIPLSAVTLSRSQIETLENTAGGAEALLAGAQVQPAGSTQGLTPVADGRDPFTWGIAPLPRAHGV